MAVEPTTILKDVLHHLGFEATIKQHALEDGVLLEIETEDAGRLIGRQGQTLSELQYVVNRLIFHADQSQPKVTLDVGNYRFQARDALVEKAKQAAEKVRRWGDVVELEPMNAFDRRIVHNALREDPDIETHSVEVEGTPMKVILLRPKH